MADEETQGGVGEANEKPGPSEDYKNLQRQLQKEKEKSKRYLRDSLQADKLQGEVSILSTALPELVKAIQESGDVDEVLQKTTAARAELETQAGFRG